MDLIFAVISSGNIRACAGCNGQPLKDGPSSYPKDSLDEEYCIRHKEEDQVWLSTVKKYKKTFDNKHYHLSKECVKTRNLRFQPGDVEVNIGHDPSSALKKLLMTRLYWLCTKNSMENDYNSIYWSLHFRPLDYGFLLLGPSEWEEGV